MASGLAVGTVVFAKFSGKIYTGVLEEAPPNVDNADKLCVRWFPDLKQCSYVRPTSIWNYLENRDHFLNKRFKELKVTKEWRKLVAAADGHLNIPSSDINSSTRGSTSDAGHSETASTSSHDTPLNKIRKSKESGDSPHFIHQSHPLDAIEMPDEEEMQSVDEAPKSRRSPAHSKNDQQNTEPKVPGKRGRKKLEAQNDLTNGHADEVVEIEEVVEEKPPAKRGRKPFLSHSPPISRSPRGRGRPPKPAAKPPPKPLPKRPVGRPPLLSRQKLTSPQQNLSEREQPKRLPLPPVGPIGGRGSKGFEEHFAAYQREVASSNLREMPKFFQSTSDSGQTQNTDFESSLRFGFIGLQSLSLIIVRHLCSNKVRVFVWDANGNSAKQAEEIGAMACSTKAQVIDSSDIIFTSMLSKEEAHEAFFTPGDGILACVDPSKGIVDLGTPNIDYVGQINQMLTGRRVAYLYCATFGNVVDAADGKLSFCVAGSDRLSKEIFDLLRSLGGTYETPDGQWSDPTMALKVKAISDMMVHAQNLALCEALGIAQRQGLPVDFISMVLRHQAKDHFSQCLPDDTSLIGAADDLYQETKSNFLLPLSRSETAAAMSSEKKDEPNAEWLRLLTSDVRYAAAFADCFNSVANEGGLNTQTLFAAMHSLIAAGSSLPNASDVSTLFQRSSSLI